MYQLFGNYRPLKDPLLLFRKGMKTPLSNSDENKEGIGTYKKIPRMGTKISVPFSPLPIVIPSLAHPTIISFPLILFHQT